MARVNIVKKIKVDGVWKLLSLPRNTKGNYDWNALPQGLYLIEWYMGGKRRRESAGERQLKRSKHSAGRSMNSKDGNWDFLVLSRPARRSRSHRFT